jgi:hypothetical protein
MRCAGSTRHRPQLPVLVFSFHSPSLAPGFTPYVRNEDDLLRFYDWWRRHSPTSPGAASPDQRQELISSVALA